MKVIKIGRSGSNDINIDDPQVSRTHCQIILDDYGNFRLIDTNSSNGTYINGVKRHGEVALNTTDIIRIGNTTLPWQQYFRVQQAASSPGTVINPGNATTYGGRPNNNAVNNVSINFASPQPQPANPEPPMYKPSNFMGGAIIATLFFFLPFGIVSLVYASKVNTLWYSGRYDEAYNAAAKARTWFWWSLFTPIILGVIAGLIIAASGGGF